MNEGTQASGSGATLVAGTEAANLTGLDFSTYTTWLGVSATSAQTWPHAAAAAAPQAVFVFEPRASWATTYYPWVRARIRQGATGSSPVHLSVDNGPFITLGCLSGNEWQWVTADVSTGKPAQFSGVNGDQQHTLTVSFGSSDLEIDQVKLAPETDHQECPVASSCGCN